ncbi:hypothetical protein HQ571_05225 [Candidatus Kuenenbacteria bacterium]|nr:hypothetical protein [Candidatus Kuenenbacteria bacterium]
MKHHKHNIIFISIIAFFVLSPIIIFAAGDPVKLAPPKIQIPIPELPQWSAVEVVPGELGSMPWIADYIIAIYKYGLLICSIAAVVAMMIGGILYMTAGGIPGNVKKAQSLIFGSITGLTIILFSHMILNIINPNLTELGSLEVETVIKLDLDVDPVYGEKGSGEGWTTGGDSGVCKAPKNSVLEYCGVPTTKAAHPNKPELIQLFKDFAACGDFNYNIIMGMCEHESSFRPGLVNCACFKGLFQFKFDTWAASMRGWPGGKDTSYYLQQIGISSNPIVKNDARLIDPKVQVMGVTGATLLAKNKIISLCKGDISKLNSSDLATLIYLYHNSGPKNLSNTLKLGGCKGGINIEKGLTESWKQIIVGRCIKRAFNKGKSECAAGDGGYQNRNWTGGNYKTVAEAEKGGEMFGAGKAISVRKAGAQRIVGKYKAENLFSAVPGAGTCPIKTK